MRQRVALSALVLDASAGEAARSCAGSGASARARLRAAARAGAASRGRACVERRPDDAQQLARAARSPARVRAAAGRPRAACVVRSRRSVRVVARSDSGARVERVGQRRRARTRPPEARAAVSSMPLPSAARWRASTLGHRRACGCSSDSQRRLVARQLAPELGELADRRVEHLEPAVGLLARSSRVERDAPRRGRCPGCPRAAPGRTRSAARRGRRRRASCVVGSTPPSGISAVVGGPGAQVDEAVGDARQADRADRRARALVQRLDAVVVERQLDLGEAVVGQVDRRDLARPCARRPGRARP